MLGSRQFPDRLESETKWNGLKMKKRHTRFDYKSEIALDLKQNQTKTTQQYFELVGINYV